MTTQDEHKMRESCEQARRIDPAISEAGMALCDRPADRPTDKTDRQTDRRKAPEMGWGVWASLDAGGDGLSHGPPAIAAAAVAIEAIAGGGLAWVLLLPAGTDAAVGACCDEAREYFVRKQRDHTRPYCIGV
ncbi:hypothetical protein JDV02_007627 [Purpureocillium takamizusanense]|uniref:Uncharacterized protein n=1 Tax=Purpureocillium takamizusanense TaxID=2060973 RepID=A0A9Q8QL15_9HYPO|nr:uncharacterized protein JDV02_007627 [Purpureocillium takamizusanense]UNI21655.1 hypothetical protein JDV02_007627 [Purpureocillium takamizusanense]